MSNYILLSFDVEEFDIPLEYNCKIDIAEQMQIGKQGLDEMLPVVDAFNIATTMFTTANFALQFPEAIQSMAVNHEIASHTYYHTTFKNEDLLSSKLALEEICGKPVTGLRMPRMRSVEMIEVIKAGYTYDSSINPTWLPGRYNNLHLSRTWYKEAGMLRLPASVSPNLRLPLFWLAFKNYPYWLFKKLAIQTLKKDGYICLYFHPWEFTAIHNYNLPNYIKKYCGTVLQDRLYQLIKDLQPYGEFSTVQSFIQQKSLP
ncbi:MAG: polysaccharide deacetylase family protein [Chitinophagaceae bacterium]|jgi:peptidoglycan/xylan/chitin deacetylase (PgdA/CDA1 family)|nr:polysaccharide deacetylase family protein [Chitinophagaceae bacterium]